MRMGEDRVYFKSGELTLEGLFAPSTGKRGVVIAHPHPLMGGNMRDNVVVTLVTLFQQNRFSTLRFNFRSVGRSEGLYDDGVGEAEDLLAAVQFLSGQGVEDISVAGYSFGALMAMKCLALTKDIRFTVLISPPPGETGISFRNLAGKRGLIVCGDRDPFCPVDELQHAAEEVLWPYEIVKGADHFYFGKETVLMEIIGKHLKTG
jgi:alpha/beta superfamily hydrolase